MMQHSYICHNLKSVELLCPHTLAHFTSQATLYLYFYLTEAILQGFYWVFSMGDI